MDERTGESQRIVDHPSEGPRQHESERAGPYGAGIIGGKRAIIIAQPRFTRLLIEATTIRAPFSLRARKDSLRWRALPVNFRRIVRLNCYIDARHDRKGDEQERAIDAGVTATPSGQFGRSGKDVP